MAVAERIAWSTRSAESHICNEERVCLCVKMVSEDRPWASGLESERPRRKRGHSPFLIGTDLLALVKG